MIGLEAGELAAVGLLRSRLRRLFSVKAARVLSLLLAIGGVVSCLALRRYDGPTVDLEGFVVRAGRWSAWVCGGLIALAAATGRDQADRQDGIEALIRLRRPGGRAIQLQRALATAIETWWVLLLPIVVVGAFATGLSTGVRMATGRLLLVGVMALFSLLAGALLSLAATVADSLRPQGGRWLLVGLVLVPWAVADFFGHPALSIPGLLGSVLSTGLELLGMSRYG